MHRKQLLGMVMVALGVAAAATAMASVQQHVLMPPGLDGVTMPRVVGYSQPEYPPAAQAARIGATVVLAVEVRADGSVGEVQVVDVNRKKLGFEEAARGAVQTWSFEPAVKDGTAVDSFIFVGMDFSSGFRASPLIGLNAFMDPGRKVAFNDSKIAASLMRADASLHASMTQPSGSKEYPLMKQSLPPCSYRGCIYNRDDVKPVPYREQPRRPAR
ncbi:MAG TPA: energy transducer TonB [Candidatus Polarisedimenticolaceae bacterium]|nr:energy transducer TonB [Candidatus Polarisedimenticolaceae bacterium]